MIRRLLPLLLVLASACSATSTDPFDNAMWDPPHDGSEPEVFAGIVESINVLRTDRGAVRLTGPNTALLTELIRARVEVRGYRDNAGASPLYVVDIRVLIVDGLPALDGILEGTDGDLRIRNGDVAVRLPVLVPEGLIEHVGKRVWVALKEGVCVRFGVLKI